MTPNSRPKVLIVDDEEDVVRPLAFRLGLQGFDVLMEPDGELGFMTALAQEPDLILLDIMMPGMDGFAVCRALKESGDTEHIPVIMLTARSRMGDIERAFALNADDYVSKPFEWDELFGKIQRALANRNAVGQA